MNALAQKGTGPIVAIAVMLLIACGGKVQVYVTPVPPTPMPTLVVALEDAAAGMGALKSLSFALTSEGAPLVPGLDARQVAGVVTPDQVSLQLMDAEGNSLDVQSDSLPLGFVGLGVTVGGLAKGLQDPVEAERQWIDNRPHRGISGTVSGALLGRLFASMAPDGNAALTLYLGDNGLVRRVRIEGPLAAGEPPEAARVLDLTDLK